MDKEKKTSLVNITHHVFPIYYILSFFLFFFFFFFFLVLLNLFLLLYIVWVHVFGI